MSTYVCTHDPCTEDCAQLENLVANVSATRKVTAVSSMMETHGVRSLADLVQEAVDSGAIAPTHQYLGQVG